MVASGPSENSDLRSRGNNGEGVGGTYSNIWLLPGGNMRAGAWNVIGVGAGTPGKADIGLPTSDGLAVKGLFKT